MKVIEVRQSNESTDWVSRTILIGSFLTATKCGRVKTVESSLVTSRGWYGLRIRVMEIPINQSGFVSNRSESQLQSQAPAPPEGRVEQSAGVLSVIALSDGESRKRGLGLRVRIPIKRRARGVKDPGWISFSSSRHYCILTGLSTCGCCIIRLDKRHICL